MNESNSTSSHATHFDRMRFAFRTATLMEDEQSLLLRTRSLQVKLLVVIPLLVTAGAVVAFFGVGTVLQLACILGAGQFVRMAWQQKPGAMKLLVRLISCVIAAYVVGSLMGTRIVASTILSVVTIVIFLWFGSRPLDFYQEWLFADRRIDAETRARLRPIRLLPNEKVLYCYLAVMMAVPHLHTASFAILLLVLLALSFLWLFAARTERPHETVRRVWNGARLLFLQYLAYPEARPLIWSPQESLPERRRTFALLLFSLAATLAVSVSYCMPWELFAAHTEPGFYYPVPGGGAGTGHAWLVRPFLLLGSAGRDYWWALLIGIGLSVALPYLLLFTVYFPALLRVAAAAEQVEAEVAADGRTEFEQYVERLAASRFVAPSAKA